VESYNATWNCSDCGYVSIYELSKREAAFFDSLALEKTSRCIKCRGTNSSGSSRSIPDIDHELLSEWASDPNLSFLSQDQDLIIADLPARLIAEFYCSEKTDESQRSWLLNAIMVKLHDENFVGAEERTWTIEFLKRHRSDWSKFYIMPYILDNITPKIELEH
jgi:predicted nucleic-acid-binding Zn-ribbon protein